MGTELVRVLVTGATGFLGNRLVKRLVDEGYAVRALVRTSSNVSALRKLSVEIAIGDLGDPASIATAVRGVDVVVHTGAGTSGTVEDSNRATIGGTRNVLESCKTTEVKKLVYISSCNVYEVAGCTDHEVVTEEAQLERFPMRRGHYSSAKLLAERMVTGGMNRDGCARVVLRPGTLYGPGGEVYTKMIGVQLAGRIFIVFGDGDEVLPLVHVDNAVDAIVECIRSSAADNQVFNVVDSDAVTKRTYVERLVRQLYPRATVIYCPMFVLVALTWLQERLTGILGKRPVLTVYRLVSSQKTIRYSASRIEQAVGWRPRITFDQAVEAMIREHGKSLDARTHA